MQRREKDKACKASVRATESSEQTLQRREKAKAHKASVRATESSEQTVLRHEKDKAHKASMRKPSNISAEQAIVHFHSDIENGPDFICTCCHHLMYSKSVVLCNLAKYSHDLLDCVFSADLRYVCDTGKEWVCKTCD